MDELENEGDLCVLVSDYLKCLNPHRNVISGIIRLVITLVVLQVKYIYCWSKGLLENLSFSKHNIDLKVWVLTLGKINLFSAIEK